MSRILDVILLHSYRGAATKLCILRTSFTLLRYQQISISLCGWGVHSLFQDSRLGSVSITLQIILSRICSLCTGLYVALSLLIRVNPTGNYLSAPDTKRCTLNIVVADEAMGKTVLPGGVPVTKNRLIGLAGMQGNIVSIISISHPW